MEAITNMIADKLKPYLGLVFRNFDPANFKFNISWTLTASLELKDLQLKPTLLRDLGLDLPFEIDLLGSVGRVYVEISFSGLTLSVSDVCVLASGLRRLTYDEKREVAAAVARKRSELEALILKEIAAAAAAEGKAPVDEEPGFVMRKVMSYVQGASVTLENVHVRFEDETEAVGAGLMLKKIAVDTVDEIADWSHGQSDSDKTFFKKGDLERLSVYWNSGLSHAELFGRDYKPSDDATTTGKTIGAIAVKLRDYVEAEKPANINYVLEPVVAAARAMITRHPEKLDEPFSLPKVHADFKLGALELRVNDLEYASGLELADRYTLIGQGRRWLEHRPAGPVKGNARAWWRMAYASAVGDVARKRRNWSWAHIKAHRLLREKYADAYLRKLTAEGKPSEDLVKEVQDLEDQLDNFNVLLARHETEEKNKIRKDLLKKKKDEETAKSGGGGWGWGWGSSASTVEVTVTKDELEAEMAKLSDEDRKKFHSLIDYDPNEGEHGAPKAAVAYPKDYDEFVLGAKLEGVKGKLLKHRGETGGPLEILNFGLVGFNVSVETHPAVSGMKAAASMKTIGITGLQEGGGTPAPDIFKSVGDKSSAAANFIDLTFETHPPSSPGADTKIVYESQAAALTYDGRTFQKLLEFVTPPAGAVHVQRVGGKGWTDGFSQVSGAQLASMGKSAATLELDIKIVAPTVLVPEGGSMTLAGDILIGNLGTLTIKAAPRSKSEAALEAVKDTKDLSPEVMAVMFNHIEVALTGLEVLLALKGEDVTRVVTRDPSYATQRPTPIAEAKNVTVDVWQCIVGEDVRFPKLKVGAGIKAINLDVVDRRFLRLVHLGLTLPLPKAKGASPTAIALDQAEDPSNSYDNAVEAVSSARIDAAGAPEEPGDPENAPQFTNLQVDLKLEEIKLNVAVQDPHTGALTPFLAYNLHAFTVSAAMRTFGMSLDASIARMHAIYIGATVPGIEGPVYLLNTPTDAEKDAPFISARVYSVTGDCPPKLAGTGAKQRVKLVIRSLDLILHQDSIKAAVGILWRLKSELESITPKVKAVPEPEPKVETMDISTGGVGGLNDFRKLTRKFATSDADALLLKATVTLSRVSLKLTSAKAQITQVSILDWLVDFEDKALVSKLISNLNNLEVLNLEAGTPFPKILTTESGSKLIDAQVLIHKTPQKGPTRVLAPTDPQYEARVRIGGPRLVILGSYLGVVMGFANEFKAAIAAAAEGASGAASAAGEAAASIGNNLYTTDVKFSVDFELQSPAVVLAKSDGSLEVLVYYFGNVRVKNGLREGASEGGHAPVFDDLKFDMDGVKLVRTILDPETGKPNSELAILEPLEIHVSLTRNLSRSWFKNAPTFKVGANLTNAVVAISDDDVIFAVGCAFDVLNHLPGPQGAEKQGEEPSASDAVPRGGVGAPVLSLDSGAIPSQPVAVEIADFTFGIEKIGLSLYKGANPLAGRSGLVPRDSTRALGGVFIEKLGASGHYFENGTLDAKLGLQDVLVQDKREQALAGLRDLIVTEGDSTGALLLDLGFRMAKVASGAQEFTVKFRSRSLRFVLNMEFIDEVARFGVSIVDKIPKRGDGSNTASHIAKAEEEHSHDIHLAPVSGLALGSTPAKAPAPAPLVNADVNLQEITLVVLQNPKSSETNAILLTTSGLVNVKSESGASKGTAQLKLSAFTSRFDVNAPAKRLGEILRPTSVDVTLELVPGSKTIVDATTSDVTIHFSAGTLHLMSKIAAEFGEALKSKHGAEEEMEDHSNAWANKRLEEGAGDKFWFLKEQQQVKATGGPAPIGSIAGVGGGAPVGGAAAPIESVTLHTGKVFLTLESGVGAMTTPLLFIDTRIEAVVNNWSSGLHVAGAVKLTCGYNNPHVGAMEYLIEPTGMLGMGGAGQYAPWELKLDVQKTPDSDTEPGKMVVNITSEKNLELMVSKSAIEILQAVATAFSTAAAPTIAPTSATSATASEAHLRSAPYVFRNTCGADLTVNVDNTAFLYYVDGAQAPPGNIPVPNGRTIYFGMHIDAIGSHESHEMLVDIPAYKFRSKVLVSQAASRHFDTQLVSSLGSPVGVLIDVAIASDYSTHVTVQSYVQVSNELSVPVELFSVFAAGKVFPAGVVEPGASASLPFQAIYERTLGLQFKPRGYSYSPAYYNWTELIAQKPESILEQTCAREAGDCASTITFNVVGAACPAVAGNSDQKLSGKNISVRLRPALTFRNLLPLPVTLVTKSCADTLCIEPGREEPVTMVASSAPIGQRASGGWGAPARAPANKLYSFTAVMAGYQGKSFTCSFTATDDPAAPSTGGIPFTESGAPPGRRGQVVYLNFERVLGTSAQGYGLTLILSAGFWVLNYTQLDISYWNQAGKFAVGHSAEDGKPAMLLTDSAPQPAAAAAQGGGGQGTPPAAQTRVCFQVGQGGWSKPVVVDTVGIPTGAICPAIGGTRAPYELSISVAMDTYNHVTKVITVAPRFTITNNCRFPVRWLDARHDDAAHPRLLPAARTVPFWPPGPADSLLPILAPVGSPDWTAPVPNEAGQYFLPLRSGVRFGGLGISVNIQETKTVFTINEFNQAEIQLLFVNALEGVSFELWEDPPPSFGGYAPPAPEVLRLDRRSRLFHAWKNPLLDPAGRAMNWRVAASGAPSYRAGLGSEATSSQAFILPDGRPATCFTFTQGLRRIIFFTHADSNFLELQRAKTAKEAAATLQLNVTLPQLTLALLNNLAGRDVLFAKLTGLSGGYIAYPLGFSASARIQDLRMDNQVPKASYTTVIDKEEKQTQGGAQPTPFLKFKASQLRATPKSNVNFLDGSLKLQEFTIGGDMDLVGNVLELVTPGAGVGGGGTVGVIDYRTPVQTVDEFYASPVAQSGGAAKAPVLFLRDLELHSTSFNVSFSMTGIDGLKERLSGNAFVGMLLGLVGTLRIGVKDAHFDLDGMHFRNQRSSTAELLEQVKSHYTQEITHGAYANIFNIDIPGSPFTLIKGLGKGLGGLLGQTTKGAKGGNIIGGVAAGAGSLVGHTVGGLTEAAGGLFGVVGGVSDALHVPLLGGLFGGVGHALEGTGKGVSKAASFGGDAGGGEGDEARMRPPRVLKLGVPIKPYAVEHPSAPTPPLPGGGGATQWGAPPTQGFGPAPPPAHVATLAAALQQMPVWAGAGPVLSEVRLAHGGVVMTKAKIFYVELASTGHVTRVSPFDWPSVQNIATDGRSTVFLDTLVPADRYRPVRRLRTPIYADSPDTRQFLLTELFKAQMQARM